jgi:hypothetical protein
MGYFFFFLAGFFFLAAMQDHLQSGYVSRRRR